MGSVDLAHQARVSGNKSFCSAKYPRPVSSTTLCKCYTKKPLNDRTPARSCPCIYPRSVYILRSDHISVNQPANCTRDRVRIESTQTRHPAPREVFTNAILKFHIPNKPTFPTTFPLRSSQGRILCLHRSTISSCPWVGGIPPKPNPGP